MNLAMGIVWLTSMLYLMWVGIADLAGSFKMGRRHRAEMRAIRTARAIDQQTRARLTELIGQGNKIQAIEDMRVVTGLGLRAAEGAVDALNSLNRSEALRLSALARLDVPADTQERARELLGRGRRLQAIVLLREEAGLSLSDALHVADGLGGDQVGSPAV